MARVLIVDDDFGTRQSFGRVLQAAGHDVLPVESGAQALDVVQREQLDVLLIDLRLLDMTALDLIRELRKRGVSTPTVVMTGFATIETAVEAIKAGAVDYVQKPLVGEDLEHAVRRALSGRAEYPPLIIRADSIARWAMAIASVLDSPHDPKTLLGWSRVRGVAPETLRAWCRTAGLSPKRSLDLARVLRAAFQARASGSSADRLLDVANHRTLRRLLDAGGLVPAGDPPSLEDVLARQSLITDPVAVDELRRVLRELGMNLDSQ